MKKEFVIQRQGRDFVLFAGLLDLAHEQGLLSLTTEVVAATATLGMFKATATFKDGRVFTSHGDATPENVGRNIAPHFLRMGETRAKARALRDALNIGAASLEELGDDDEPSARPAAPRREAPPVEGRRAPAQAVPAAPTPIRAETEHVDEWERERPPGEGAPGDDVDALTGLELVDACDRMRRRLNAARVDFAAIPEPRTNNALRHWWKLAAGVLADRS